MFWFYLNNCSSWPLWNNFSAWIYSARKIVKPPKWPRIYIAYFGQTHPNQANPYVMLTSETEPSFDKDWLNFFILFWGISHFLKSTLKGHSNNLVIKGSVQCKNFLHQTVVQPPQYRRWSSFYPNYPFYPGFSSSGLKFSFFRPQPVVQLPLLKTTACGVTVSSLHHSLWYRCLVLIT